jgi:hypothetical protein
MDQTPLVLTISDNQGVMVQSPPVTVTVRP